MKIIDKWGCVWYCVASDFRTVGGAKVMRFRLLKDFNGERLDLIRYTHGEYYCLMQGYGYQFKYSVRSFFPSWDLRTLSRGCM